jgi:hypothetical protein
MKQFSKEVEMANKHMKKYLTFLTTKEMQIKRTSPQSEWLSSRKQTTTNSGEDARRKEPLHITGKNVT